MGEFKATNGTRSFKPDDTGNLLHIQSNDYTSIEDLIDRARNHFGPHAALSDINISAEQIHTRCLGHDCYDPQDYDEYIILTL